MSKSKAVPHCQRLVASLVGAALLLAAAAFVAPARAQSNYDDGTLRAFAQAATTVLALRGNYYPRVRAAEIAGADDKAEILFNEMRQLMRTAIDNAGLTEAQYRAISDATKTDAGLHQRINEMLQAPPPAQQHFQNVTRVTPPAAKAPAAPAPAAAPPAATPSPATAAPEPATPEPAAPAAARQPVGLPQSASPEQLASELDKATAERARYRAEQQALREKVAALEQQLASVKEQDSAQRTQLIAEKERAQAEQEEAERQLARLRAEVGDLKSTLASAQSHDAELREQLDAARAHAEAEQRAKEAKLAAFQQEIERLAGRLARARQSLETLADTLGPAAAPPAAPAAPAFQALMPLQREPTSIERVLAKAQPHFAEREQLNEEIARTQKELRRREAERTALQQEIADLSHELAATYRAMAELIGQPEGRAVAAAELDLDDETYTSLDLSHETAQLFQAQLSERAQALLEPPAGLLIDNAGVVDGGDPVVEPGAAEPADSAALEPPAGAAFRLNPAPAAQIATAPAAPQSAHRIARESQPAAVATPAQRYETSVRGGANAYRAGDFREAYEIWAGLAEAGNRSAQFHLGALYFEGRGTRADAAQSHFWLQVATFQGDQRAAALLAVVAAKLTQRQLDASRQQARAWLQRHALEVTQAAPPAGNQL